ncbi:MAG: Hpt domain-containing protein [Anaerolineae bacterium]|nr:MAG: Hpt domain-containing protein [Anaerolineae bacterium]
MAIDPSVINEYREVLGEEFAPFFTDLIETFFTSGPEFIETMKEALNANDAESFTRAAHTLKSNCKTFGAMEFAEMAYELEKLGSAGDLNTARQKLPILEASYQQLVAELENLRDQLGK